MTKRGPGVVVVALLAASGCARSDESVLREELRIPRTVRLLEIESSPDRPGFFGREGLDIRAVFGFTGEQFEAYVREADTDEAWRPLPVPDGFLEKLFGLATYRRSLELSYAARGEPVPELGSVHNPSDEQLVARWRELLPLDVGDSLFTCRTAGDDIMRGTRVRCSERPGDLNDFIFGVLDRETRRLTVRVRTSY